MLHGMECILQVDRHSAAGRDRAAPQVRRKFRKQPRGGDRPGALRRSGKRQRRKPESDKFLAGNGRAEKLPK